MFVENIELRKRFCKDNNLPIKLYQSPYFEERLSLIERYIDIKQQKEDFLNLCDTVKNSQQSLLDVYSNVKDAAINYLNESPEMIYFSREEDMGKYSIKNKNLPKNSIYNDNNVGKNFLSIDMKKANFTVLKHYNKNIVKNQDTYEDFIKQFTDIDYFTRSKYIRQVIFGNVNPKRQLTYSQFLMDKVLSEMLTVLPKEKVISFLSDEIIFDISDIVFTEKFKDIVKSIENIINKFEKDGISLRLEMFQLLKINGTSGYMKKMFYSEDKRSFVLKGVNSVEMPFVLRKIFNESPIESDFVFFYEGKLAKLMNPLVIEI